MLRPDFTLPIVRLHMEAGAEPARYVYCGPVWRRQEFGSDRPREYLQAGFEIFEAGDPAATDAEVLGLVAAGARRRAGRPRHRRPRPRLRGRSTRSTPAPRARMALRRHVWRPARFRALLDRYGEGHAAAAAAPRGAARRRGRGARRRRWSPAPAPPSACARPRTSPRGSRALARRGAHAAARPPARWRGSRRCSAVAGTAADALAELRALARGLAPLGAAVDRLDGAARGAGGARDRAGGAALRGELRPHHARILRRLRLRRAAARPARPAADRQRRALRRADPRPRPRPRHPGGRRHAAARGAGGADRGRGMLRLGVPSKGRLQEETIAWFAARGIRVAGRGRGASTAAPSRGSTASSWCCSSAGEIPGELAVGRARPRGHRAGSGARARSRAGRSGSRSWRRWASASPTSSSRCRPSGSTSTEMARPRRRGRAVPRPARPPAAGRDQVPPSGPRRSSSATASPTTCSSTARARPRAR